MNNRIINRLAMYETVELLHRKHQPIIQSVPALAAAFSQFSAMLINLRAHIQTSISDRKGITHDKNRSRAKLSHYILVVSGMIKSFASDTNNLELFGAAHYTPSDLRNMRNHRVYSVACIVRSLADKHSQQLVPFGLTSELWSKFLAAISDYENRMHSPETATKMHAACTKAIKNIDADIRRHLHDRIDTAIRVLEESNPQFVAIYRGGRSIINHAATHASPAAPPEADFEQTGNKQNITTQSTPQITLQPLVSTNGNNVNPAVVMLSGSDNNRSVAKAVG